MDWCLNHPEEPPTESIKPMQLTPPKKEDSPKPMDLKPPTTQNPTELTTPTEEISKPMELDSNKPVESVETAPMDSEDFDEQLALEMSKQQEDKVWTPEEIEKEKLKLNEKILAIRQKKKEDERLREIDREIQRRQSGKSAQEAQRLWEDNKIKREEFLKKKEKEDEKKSQKSNSRKNRFRQERESQKVRPNPHRKTCRTNKLPNTNTTCSKEGL